MAFLSVVAGAVRFSMSGYDVPLGMSSHVRARKFNMQLVRKSVSFIQRYGYSLAPAQYSLAELLFEQRR